MASVIQQIADELNVSNASVSRALNDRPGVSDQLRARILERAKELNYTPGVTARGLAMSQTFGIGFFVREKTGLTAQTDPFYGEILRGVEKRISNSDYHLTIATLTDENLMNPDQFRFVRERRIDGMILAGPDIPTDFIMRMLRTDIPVILVDNRLSHSKINCVNSDDEAGGYLAARHLIRLGHEKIGIISGPTHWISNTRRVNGYKRACAETNVTCFCVYGNRTDIESGEETCARLFREYPEVTAICAVNDAMAIGAIRAAEQLGKTIPEDLSVVGFDDIALAGWHRPSLTTIRIPKHQLGMETAHRLTELMRNGKDEIASVEIIVSVDLVVRSSTRALA